MRTETKITKIFTSYVAKSVYRKNIELHRQATSKIQLIPVEDWKLAVLQENQRTETDDLADLNLDQLQELASYIQNDYLLKAMSVLNDRQKAIIYLKFVGNYTNFEIGQMLGGVSSQTIGKQIKVAIKRIDKMQQKIGDEDDE